MHCFVITLFLIGFELSSCLTCLLFDISEELQEVLCVFLEHLLRADETELTHFIEVSQSLDLFVFLFKEHLDEEHLALLLNQVPTVLPVLGSFDGDVEACILSDINFVCYVGIDGQGCRLNIGFTELTEAAFSRRSILLPDLELLIGLSLTLFPGALLVLEREDAIVTRVCERIRVLFEAKE